MKKKLDTVSGGVFEFDWRYFKHKDELRIKCPVCGAEGTLVSQRQGWLGTSNGRVAIDSSVCSNCNANVNIEPELGKLVVVHFNRETLEYSEETYPFHW